MEKKAIRRWKKETEVNPVARKKPAKKTHYNYTLRKGRIKVYEGTSKDPARRKSEHKHSGKKFTSMTVGPKVSKKTALSREHSAIKTYKKNQGRRPRHNKKG